jgi:hypothetical protein
VTSARLTPRAQEAGVERRKRVLARLETREKRSLEKALRCEP